MDAFAALPLPLLKLIVAFASEGRHEDVIPHAPWVPEHLLRAIAQSDPLLPPIMELLRGELDVATSISIDSERSALSISSFLQGRRTTSLKSLEIMIYGSSGDALVQWRQLFASLPRLERLDLSKIHLTSDQLPAIIDAAATCNRVKALILSAWVRDQSELTSAKMMALRTSVYKAIQQWHDNGAGGGLKQLEFPLRYSQDEIMDVAHLEALDSEFFEVVTKNCRGIEYLNTFDLPDEAKTYVLASKMAHCSLEVWTEFCRNCCSLREVAWISLPYSDPHLKIFGSESRPTIPKLVFDGLEGPHAIDAEGTALYSIYGIMAVLSACANLLVLDVRFAHSLSIPHGMHRQSLWNNTVLSTISRCCPRLQEYKLLEYSSAGDANIPTPLDSTSDVGVTALAQLADLRLVKMKATSVTGAGVFELIKCSPRHGEPRIVKLDVGCLLLEGFVDDDESGIVEFYTVVLGTLERVVEAAALIQGQRFRVKLINRSRRDPDTEEWRDELMKLVARAPIHVRIDEDFGRIERITLTSHPH